MFTRLLQALGWVTKEEREGRRIDYGSSLCVTSIRNKSEFLVNMLDLVPDGSVWSIEGIHDEQILADLAPYRTTDDVRVIKATIWPRQTQIKVLLNTDARGGPCRGRRLIHLARLKHASSALTGPASDRRSPARPAQPRSQAGSALPARRRGHSLHPHLLPR